jgi:hypothetical protein
MDFERAKGGSNRDPTKPILQRFRQFFAELASCRDRWVRIIRHVGQPMNRGNVTENKIPHNE